MITVHTLLLGELPGGTRKPAERPVKPQKHGVQPRSRDIIGARRFCQGRLSGNLQTELSGWYMEITTKSVAGWPSPDFINTQQPH